jgi:glycosyltransferase involved in cell wall biosynthesis
MRVLLITDWMSSPGGTEGYIASIREGLRTAGDDVRLLTSSAGSSADGTADHRAYSSDRLLPLAFLQILNPFAVAELRRALRTFRPDVALVGTFAYHLSPAILRRLRGVPTVLSVMDYKCICPLGSKLLPSGGRCTQRAGLVCRRSGCVGTAHWIRDQPRYRLIRSAVRRVDRILACSRWVQQELAAEGLRSERLPLPVTPPGGLFRRKPASEPLFVYCGRLEVEKGLPLLLRAFARVQAGIPSARLRIVGRGSQRHLLERLTDRLGISRVVSFRGAVAPAEVEHDLADAWAVVAPSLWAEPFGLIALEAIIRAVPVVASADGGFGETIEQGVSGLLFPNGDEDALVERLEAVAHLRAFPDHLVPGEAVERARMSADLGDHIARLRRILAEVAGARAHRS